MRRQWSDHADLLLALSPMTMPHELARVILAEQIYRAIRVSRGVAHALMRAAFTLL
jgi:23S rRNA (pseudouridine1915-N3)-methyltransferase